MGDGSKKRSRAGIVWLLFAIFIVYPLSVGPADLLVHRTHSVFLGRIFSMLLTVRFGGLRNPPSH